jgi:hypothetical protein
MPLTLYFDLVSLPEHCMQHAPYSAVRLAQVCISTYPEMVCGCNPTAAYCSTLCWFHHKQLAAAAEAVPALDNTC